MHLLLVYREVFMRNQILEAGKIVNTHGLRGEVKILPWVDDAKLFQKLSTFYLDKQKEKSIEITHVRFQNTTIIAKIKGIDDINDAEYYKNKILYVEREHIGEPPEGRYYICDLIGMEVANEEGELLGTVKDVTSAGSANVYVVARPHQKDLLLPAVPSVVKKVDIDQNQMVVHLLEGLDEL